ncbi:MAG: nicotinate phosphoribosyltransferase, partial [Planctomycetota bacterium]
RPTRKRSEGKATWPGVKQVYRDVSGGVLRQDAVVLEGEQAAGEPLLVPVISGGRVTRRETLETIRRRCRQQIELLPDDLRHLDRRAEAPVRVSDSIRRLAHELDQRQ